MMLAVFKVSPIVATEVNVKSILIVLRYPIIIRKTSVRKVTKIIPPIFPHCEVHRFSIPV